MCVLKSECLKRKYNYAESFTVEVILKHKADRTAYGVTLMSIRLPYDYYRQMLLKFSYHKFCDFIMVNSHHVVVRVIAACLIGKYVH